MAPPLFMLRVRAAPNVDVIRSLSAWLKLGLRTFGLRCVSIEQTQEREMVDVRKYSSGLITPDEVRERPIEAHIVNVYENEKHGCLVLELDNGDQFWVWPGKGRALARAYGYESKDWIGHLVRFAHGTYVDKKDEVTKETVNVTPVSSRDGNAARSSRRRARWSARCRGSAPICTMWLNTSSTLAAK